MRPIVSKPRRLEALSTAFTPATPVSREDLFAGRGRELNAALDAIALPGQHAVLYGERGVGKTSLANVIGLVRAHPIAVATCSKSDSFESVWTRLLDQLSVTTDSGPYGLGSAGRDQATAVSAMLPGGRVRPEDVALALATIGKPVLLVIDEFDKLNQDRPVFADTIKVLSDRGVDATVLIVGVAESVVDLVDDHASVERCLYQIRMPRMSDAEVDELLAQGFQLAGMQSEAKARMLMTRLSQGLPSAAHLLGLWSGRQAVAERREEVITEDVLGAIPAALEQMGVTLAEVYDEATYSSRPKALFRHVLLACAFARTDSRGRFAAADVRGPLRRFTGRNYDIPNYAKHLAAFIGGDERTAVLQRLGEPRRYRYRFINPLMRPYVALKGVEDRLVNPMDIVALGRQP